MAKYAFVADVHCWPHSQCGGPVKQAGTNRRSMQICTALAHAITVAHGEGCSTFTVLGDLVERANPTPQLLTDIREALNGCPGISVFLVVGNHDQVSLTEGDHALGPLETIACPGVKGAVDVLSGVHYSQELVTIASRPGKASEWLPTIRLPDDRLQRAIGFHLGVMDGDTPPFLRDVHDAIHVDQLVPLMKKANMTHAFAGNWHWHKQWGIDGCTIVQCGPLVPNGWRDPGLEGVGKLVIWDTDTGEVETKEIPGPRFLETTLDDQEEFLATRAALTLGDSELRGYDLYLKVKAPPNRLTEASALVQRLQREGVICDGFIAPDRTLVEKATKRAAKAAKRGTTLEAQLATYVRKMPLAEGVDRAAVHERLRGYLG